LFISYQINQWSGPVYPTHQNLIVIESSVSNGHYSLDREILDHEFKNQKRQTQHVGYPESPTPCMHNDKDQNNHAYT